MTEPPESTLAAVNEVVRRLVDAGHRGGALYVVGEYRDELEAAILAATPTAAMEVCGCCEDGCIHGTVTPCPHCRGRLLVPATPTAAHVAELEAALAAAEARLRAVEALHGDRHWCIEPEREQLLFYRPTRDLWPCATLAALTPPQPAP